MRPLIVLSLLVSLGTLAACDDGGGAGRIVLGPDEEVTLRRIEAFLADDFATAFTFASPSIKQPSATRMSVASMSSYTVSRSISRS